MAHAQKSDFVVRRNGRVHLNQRGTSIQSTAGSRGVRISVSNAGYNAFQGTGYPLHSPVSSSLPLPCVTVCHQVSNAIYYIEIQLTLQNVRGIFRQIAGILAVFQNWYLFIYSTISCGTSDDGLRNPGWETVDKMIVDNTEILLQCLNEESK